MKITVGQLKKMIHSQLAEAKKPPRSNVADYNQHRIAVDTVKNPNKSMFGGPSAEESEEILRNKFGYTDQEINMLKGVTESRSSGDVKKINEGKKRYYTQDNIGRAKYTVSFHDGVSKHDDGGDFFNIKIFHNKRERDAFIKQLTANGYHERGVMEDGFKPKGEVKKINEATFTKLIKKLIVEETEALKSGKLNESITRYYLETWVDGKQRVGSDNTLAFGDNPVGSTALKNRVAMRINIMKKSFNIYPELKTAKSIVLKYVKNSYTGGGDSVIREFDVTKQVQSSI